MRYAVTRSMAERSDQKLWHRRRLSAGQSTRFGPCSTIDRGYSPPGPDRRDAFFAETHPRERSHARLYLGIAAQGRSPKVVMLRVYLVLLAAAQRAYLAHGRNVTLPTPLIPT